jgi:inhibitor of KinA sporulation pathway (predicted exonuclease)
MTFNCDQIVIFDLEATCWEGREHFHKYREVIALGACILDLKTLVISNKFNVVCKPIRSEISEYCTRITGITKEQAENGEDFGEMCKMVMKELNTKSITCANI